MMTDFKPENEIIVEVLTERSRHFQKQADREKKRSELILQAPIELAELRKNALEQLQANKQSRALQKKLETWSVRERELLMLLKEDFMKYDEEAFHFEQKSAACKNLAARISLHGVR